jgi:hypothetical protein
MSNEQRARLAAMRAQEADPVQREAYALAERAGFDWHDTESSARRMAEHAAEELVALKCCQTELLDSLREAYELLGVARSAMYKLGLAGRGSDALPHETRMFALHFSPDEILTLPGGMKRTGDGRLAKFWTAGNETFKKAEQKWMRNIAAG